jgi:hypothetical protein
MSESVTAQNATAATSLELGLAALTTGLSAVLASAGYTDEPVAVLSRESHPYVSSYPSEVVTCGLANGEELKLFCKYSGSNARHLAFGHRGGLDREAEVYRKVLSVGGSSAPRFYGTFDDTDKGMSCLVIEYLGGAVKFNKEQDGQLRASQWLAGFHRENATRAVDASLAFLPRYDFTYFRGWIDRTIDYARPSTKELNWLNDLESHADAICEVLAAAPATVVHGEFYKDNVLSLAKVIMPVDWESAAIGPGEIDVASLTQGWGQEACDEVEAAYCAVRWPHGTPASFARALLAARIYFRVRWLGEFPGWPSREGFVWTARELESVVAHWTASG